MKTLREIGDQLRANNNYVLVSHSIPDGDSIGSLIGLFWALKSINKEVCIIIEDNPPPIYSYLNGVDLIKTAEGLDPQWRKVIFLDCSDAGRVGDKTRLFLKDREYFINIDHHTTNELFAQYNYVDPKAAATAQIVYELLEEMKIAITPNIADPLFAGLVMDTGSFLNTNTSAKTLRIAANLLELGVDIEKTRNNLFESKPREEVLLLKEALKNISFTENGKIAWMVLSFQDVQAVNGQNLHPEGIINYTRMIRGVEVGLLFREVEPNIIKIGFRSKGKIDVSLIAQKFGGGGHPQAAGARQEGQLRDICTKVINAVKDVVK